MGTMPEVIQGGGGGGQKKKALGAFSEDEVIRSLFERNFL